MSLRSLSNRLLFRRPWIAAPVLMLFGCNLSADTTVPIPVQVFGDPGQAEHIIALLPGIRDRGEDFIDEGFVEDARPLIERGRVALLVVDAHAGYYRERIVTERLKADILDAWPQRRLILAGISLGGFGALTVARRYPGRIEALLLLAPFLGEEDFLQRVAAGPPEPQTGDEPLQQELVPIWRFLISEERPPLSLVYGRNDDFAAHYAALRRLGADFPMTAIDGGHNWKTWRRLWRQWLQTLS